MEEPHLLEQEVPGGRETDPVRDRESQGWARDPELADHPPTKRAGEFPAVPDLPDHLQEDVLFMKNLMS